MTTRYTPADLAQFAAVSSFRFDSLRDASDGREWRIGALGFWKSAATPVHFHERRVATYRRGSLVFDLPTDARLVTTPFALDDGTPATAIVLRSPEEEVFVAWTSNDGEAKRVAAFLNSELEALRVALAPNPVDTTT